MMMPLVLFGGLVTIPMYYYNNVYTCAQIELLTIDVPIISYKKDKKKKGKGEKTEFKKADAIDTIIKAQEWEQKYGGENKKNITYDLTQFKIN